MNKVSDQQTPMLLFLHIPKAAGTTLQQIIERQYPSSQIYSLGADSHQSIAEFQAWPQERQADIHILKGHLAFGFHESIPRSCTYFTILREPVERTISYYYFVLQNPEHYLHQQVVSEKLDLSDVLGRKMTPDLDNGQARLISGVWNEVPVGEMTRVHLAQAKENLNNHFQVVGLANHFDASLLLLQKAFGWRRIFYTKTNITQNRPPQTALSPETIEKILQYNRLDVELYAFAQQLFERQLKQQTILFRLWVHGFKLLNWGYGRVYHRHIYPYLTKHL